MEETKSLVKPTCLAQSWLGTQKVGGKLVPGQSGSLYYLHLAQGYLDASKELKTLVLLLNSQQSYGVG